MLAAKMAEKSVKKGGGEGKTVCGKRGVAVFGVFPIRVLLLCVESLSHDKVEARGGGGEGGEGKGLQKKEGPKITREYLAKLLGYGL